MARFLVVGIIFLLTVTPAEAATVTFLTSGTTYTTPSDWTTTNTVECVGAGGNGVPGNAAVGLAGGGGGAYAKVSNLALSGSIAYVVGTGGSQNDTYFNGAASTTASLSCAPGRNGVVGTGGSGGKVVDSTGTVEFAGGSGDGGNGVCIDFLDGEGGGGGGAGGLNGAGLNGDFTGVGGNGDAGFGGTGGLSGDGGAGKEWNYAQFLYGSGGGGGMNGDGGLYGGGGGGGGTSDCYDTTAGSGAQGIIVIQYWPTLSSMIKVFGGRTLIQGGKVNIY